jgi:hypothetical protein
MGICPIDVEKGNVDAQPMSIRLSSSHHQLRFVQVLSKVNLRAGLESLAEFRLGPARLMRALR